MRRLQPGSFQSTRIIGQPGSKDQRREKSLWPRHLRKALYGELIWSLRRQMGCRQSEGGNRALGSPLSARTTAVLAHLLPQRHFPEHQGLNLDPMPRCHDKQCKFSSKPLNSSDVRPATDHSRPMSSTEKNYHMLLRKVLCYLRNPQVLQR